jgi:hypothetical protein
MYIELMFWWPESLGPQTYAIRLVRPELHLDSQGNKLFRSEIKRGCTVYQTFYTFQADVAITVTFRAARWRMALATFLGPLATPEANDTVLREVVSTKPDIFGALLGNDSTGHQETSAFNRDSHSRPQRLLLGDPDQSAQVAFMIGRSDLPPTPLFIQDVASIELAIALAEKLSPGFWTLLRQSA